MDPSWSTLQSPCEEKLAHLVHVNEGQLPQEGDVQYLWLHLYRRLTCCKHIFAKQKQLGITITRMYWLLGWKSKFSTSNKLLIHKVILKPIWSHRIQLCGTASTSNKDIPEHVQSKALYIVVEPPWFMPNTIM
jgi:hypothetical protein